MGQVPIKGKHTHRYENGDVYDGVWENSQKHGPAVMTFANGDIYTGAYNCDKRHGEGTMVYNSTQSDSRTALPEYIPNNQLSFRNRVWLRAQQWRQQQTELANVYLGTFDGFFLSDCRNAFGTFSYSNNSLFFGEWSQDMRNGFGVLISSSLDEFEGMFNSNSMHGWGAMKYNCLDREAINQSISIRKSVLKFQVMAHLYKNKFKKALPRQYKLPQTFLLDGLVHTPLDGSLASSLSSSSSGYISTLSSTPQLSSSAPNTSTNKTEQFLEIGIADIGAFTKPPQAVQQTKVVGQLLDYTIQTLQNKQFLMQKYDTLLFITHDLEVEGYWVTNQLTGPLSPEQLSKPAPKQEGNLDGYCIVKKYTRLTDDNAQQLYQLQQELEHAYHSSDNTTDSPVTRYATILTQQSLQYLVEIRLVSILTGRRIVETYGKIDLDVLEKELAEEMNIADDEFDDILSGSSTNTQDEEESAHVKKKKAVSSPEAALSPDGTDGIAFTMSFRSPQKPLQQAQHLEQAKAVGADEADSDRQLDAISAPSSAASSLTKSSHLHHSTPNSTKLVPTPVVTQHQMANNLSAGYDLNHEYEFESLAPAINLDSDDDDDGDNHNKNNGMEITLDLDDDQPKHVNNHPEGDDEQNESSMKTIQDAMKRIEAMFGDDEDDDNFTIGDDDDDDVE